MKDYFSWTLDEVLQHTAPIFNWTEEERPKEFKQNILNPGAKEINVSSSGWVGNPNKATLKYSRFQSAIIDICTVMIYPTASPDKLPVFACEWVAVMDNIHVIVLDVSYLHDNKVIEDLVTINSKWQHSFPNNDEYPLWFSEIASPQHIFSKGNISDLHELKSMFIDYLNYTTELIYKSKIDYAQAGSDHQLVQQYKIHHAHNSPARTIIKKENAGWLNTFLNNYHFGIYNGAIG